MPLLVFGVRCGPPGPASLAGLEAYAKNALRDPDQDARWKQIAKVLKKAKVVGPGVARLRIEYAHSPLGRSLVEAGHCTGSRVYAIGVDPFKGWPKHMRGAAFHDMGWECDDDAATTPCKLRMDWDACDASCPIGQKCRDHHFQKTRVLLSF